MSENEQVHIDPESVQSISRTARKIAEAMPDSVPKAKSAVAGAMNGNEGTVVADSLQGSFDAWSSEHALLIQQVNGFAADLNNAVAHWHEMEADAVEVLARYGKDL